MRGESSNKKDGEETQNDDDAKEVVESAKTRNLRDDSIENKSHSYKNLQKLCPFCR